jgi:hypothetical protein
VTLPPTAATLLRALHAAGGSLPYRDALAVTPGTALALAPLRHAGLASFVDPAVHSSGVATVELTPAGRQEAERMEAK